MYNVMYSIGFGIPGDWITIELEETGVEQQGHGERGGRGGAGLSCAWRKTRPDSQEKRKEDDARKDATAAGGETYSTVSVHKSDVHNKWDDNTRCTHTESRFLAWQPRSDYSIKHLRAHHFLLLFSISYRPSNYCSAPRRFSW